MVMDDEDTMMDEDDAITYTEAMLEDIPEDEPDLMMDEEFLTYQDAMAGTTGHEDYNEGATEDPNATLVNDEEDEDAYINSEEDSEPAPAKAPWSEYTIQTEEMGRIGICVNTEAKVIVCLECAFVVKPPELFQHVSKFHPRMSTTTTYHQELSETYDLHPDPVDTRPGTIVTAIYGLELVEAYWSCDTCGHACKSKKSMDRHIGKSKGCGTYRKRHAQTFRPSSNRAYFGVTLGPTEDPPEDPLDPIAYLKKKYTPPPFKDVPITSSKNSRDANHFLNLEKWDQYVAGKTGAELNQMTRGREPDKRRAVRACVERYTDIVVAQLAKADNEPRAAMADYLG